MIKAVASPICDGAKNPELGVRCSPRQRTSKICLSSSAFSQFCVTAWMNYSIISLLGLKSAFAILCLIVEANWPIWYSEWVTYQATRHPSPRSSRRGFIILKSSLRDKRECLPAIAAQWSSFDCLWRQAMEIRPFANGLMSSSKCRPALARGLYVQGLVSCCTSL